MALLAWWSAAEAKLITNREKINELSDFVQMLQTVPVSSNFEVIIMFTRQFAINPWVNNEYFSFIKILLQQLIQVLINISIYFVKVALTN